MRVMRLWPVDTTKAGRDFGQHLRDELPKLFPNGELTQIRDRRTYEANIAALERLAVNASSKRNAGQDWSICVNRFGTATGLQKDKLSIATSSDFLRKKHRFENAFITSMREIITKPFSSMSDNKKEDKK